MEWTLYTANYFWCVISQTAVPHPSYKPPVSLSLSTQQIPVLYETVVLWRYIQFLFCLKPFSLSGNWRFLSTTCCTKLSEHSSSSKIYWHFLWYRLHAHIEKCQVRLGHLWWWNYIDFNVFNDKKAPTSLPQEKIFRKCWHLCRHLKRNPVTLWVCFDFN